MSLALWFASISWPVVSRVMVALGFGILTYVGLDSAVSTALGHAKSVLAGLPGDVLFILAKAGLFEALAIVSGGLVGSLTFLTINRFALRNVGS